MKSKTFPPCPAPSRSLGLGQLVHLLVLVAQQALQLGDAGLELGDAGALIDNGTLGLRQLALQLLHLALQRLVDVLLATQLL
jgi:hypothetical protein